MNRSEAYSEHVAGRRMYCGAVEWCEGEFTLQEQQKRVETTLGLQFFGFTALV